MAMHQIRSTPDSAASASSVRCQSAARSGAARRARTPNQYISIQSCSIAHTPHRRASSNHRRKNAGSTGCAASVVDPPLALGEVRRPRRDVPGVDHQRRVPESLAELLDRVAARRRRVERVGARLPRHQARRRHLVGVADLGDRSRHLVLVAPRVQLHGADRHAVGHQRLDRVGDAGPDRPTGLGAIPVGGAVVGPVRQVRGDRVGVPRPPRPPGAHRAPQRSSTSAAESPSKMPSVVEKPAGTSSRSPCQPQRSAPSATASTCSCGWSSGASQTWRRPTRPSSIPSAGGECRFGAGSKSKSSVGPATHRQARTG